MIRADLYENTIQIESYVTSQDCSACGFHSRSEFLDNLRAGRLQPSQCKMTKMRFLPLLWGARPNEILPDVQVFQHPSPSPAGIVPVNQPKKNSPVLVSGNSKLTVEVMTAVLSTTSSPFWYLVVDTDGHTVDMAMVYETFTSKRVVHGIKQINLDQIAPDATLFLPGFAASIREELSGKIHHSVAIAPVCAAELPLFFGKTLWQVA
ncbi:MAG: hypothetical protein JSW04_10130 [Desulfobacterales bacterium]|nr:MAG: hypothetical protein JSW04_10130 [Desulfobacterales bacterium]